MEVQILLKRDEATPKPVVQNSIVQLGPDKRVDVLVENIEVEAVVEKPIIVMVNGTVGTVLTNAELQAVRGLGTISGSDLTVSTSSPTEDDLGDEGDIWFKI